MLATSTYPSFSTAYQLECGQGKFIAYRKVLRPLHVIHCYTSTEAIRLTTAHCLLSCPGKVFLAGPRHAAINQTESPGTSIDSDSIHCSRSSPVYPDPSIIRIVQYRAHQSCSQSKNTLNIIPSRKLTVAHSQE